MCSGREYEGGGQKGTNSPCPSFPCAESHRTGCILPRLPLARGPYMCPGALRTAGRPGSLNVRTMDNTCNFLVSCAFSWRLRSSYQSLWLDLASGDFNSARLVPARKRSQSSARFLKNEYVLISRVAEDFQIRSLEQCERSMCHCILCCRGNRFPHQSRKSVRNRLEKMILCSTYKEVSL